MDKELRRVFVNVNKEQQEITLLLMSRLLAIEEVLIVANLTDAKSLRDAATYALAAADQRLRAEKHKNDDA